jgi:hypothetical protein
MMVSWARSTGSWFEEAELVFQRTSYVEFGDLSCSTICEQVQRLSHACLNGIDARRAYPCGSQVQLLGQFGQVVSHWMKSVNGSWSSVSPALVHLSSPNQRIQ